MVQADQRNHALHAVQGDLQYHGVQKYLEVQRYQQSPVTKVHSSHLVSAQFKIVQVILFFWLPKGHKALTGGPSAPGDPLSPPGPGDPTAPASPGRPAGPVSPRPPL